MKNTYNIVNILVGVLQDAGLTITGAVYRQGERPINSKLEDVVVNSLPVTNGQVQQTVANVNAHVPNLNININGIGNAQPDLVRLETITSQVCAAVDEQYFSDHWFFVQQQSFFSEAQETYSNIRIEFYFENI